MINWEHPHCGVGWDVDTVVLQTGDRFITAGKSLALRYHSLEDTLRELFYRDVCTFYCRHICSPSMTEFLAPDLMTVLSDGISDNSSSQLVKQCHDVTFCHAG